MKIGILTYHRTLNYGACLQAVATRVTLQKMGHEVYYVDYWPEYHSRSYKAFSIKKLLGSNYKKGYKYFIESIKNFRFKKQRIANFETFFEEHIYPFCKPLSEEYDVIVYGSDQIWRKQSALSAYNPVYFGKNSLKAKRHVAYSASMGVLPKTDKDKATVKEYASHLDKIAVREQDLKDLLGSLGYKDVTLTLDPTLLLSANEWDEIIPTQNIDNEKYVLVYGINKVSFNMQEIMEFANKHNCKIKVLSGTASAWDTDELITTANPTKFISLIKNAEYIFTSSFHGLAFSIIYHKEFFASYTKNSNRAKTLLDSLCIYGRISTDGTIPNDFAPIDYDNVAQCLRKNLNNSLEYLSNVL